MVSFDGGFSMRRLRIAVSERIPALLFSDDFGSRVEWPLGVKCYGEPVCRVLGTSVVQLCGELVGGTGGAGCWLRGWVEQAGRGW